MATTLRFNVSDGVFGFFERWRSCSGGRAGGKGQIGRKVDISAATSEFLTVGKMFKSGAVASDNGQTEATHPLNDEQARQGDDVAHGAKYKHVDVACACTSRLRRLISEPSIEFPAASHLSAMPFL